MLRIEFDTSNDSFADASTTELTAQDRAIGLEVGRILLQLADMFVDGTHGTAGAVLDTNGNKVGTWLFEPRGWTMTQHYFNTRDASSPTRLPDLETFYIGRFTPAGECPACVDVEPDSHHDNDHVGWYWQACFPGCLPDGDAEGPFDSEEDALADAREGMED